MPPKTKFEILLEDLLLHVQSDQLDVRFDLEESGFDAATAEVINRKGFQLKRNLQPITLVDPSTKPMGIGSLFESKSNHNLRVSIFDGTALLDLQAFSADATITSRIGAFSLAVEHLFNGSTIDRSRNNHVVTQLSSAVRTATTTTDITTYNAKKLIIILDISVAPSVETLTLAAGMVDSVAGDVIEMIVTTADVDAGKHVIIIDPSGGADAFTDASSQIQQEVRTDLPLPRTVRATVTHSASGNWTYSVEAHLLN